MSKPVDIYDHLITRLGAVLSTHARLPNPYKPDENAEAFLVKGYGLKIGPGTNTQRTMTCGKIFEERNFTIVLSRKYFAREDDAANKAVAERELMNDSWLVKNEIEKDPTLGGKSANAYFVSDTGTNYVFSDKDRFLLNELTVSIEYVESLL